MLKDEWRLCHKKSTLTFTEVWNLGGFECRFTDSTDEVNLVAGLSGVEQDIYSWLSSSPCTTWTMNERLDFSWRGSLDDKLDIREVQASSSNIRGYYCSDLSRLEILIYTTSLLLLYITMKFCSFYSELIN